MNTRRNRWLAALLLPPLVLYFAIRAQLSWRPRSFSAPGLRLTCLAWSPNGRWLAAAGRGSDGRDVLQFRDTDSFAVQRSIKTADFDLAKLAFSPDSRTLAGLDAGGGPLRLWDVASARLRANAAIPADGSVNDFAFSPDGRILATVGTYACGTNVPCLALRDATTLQPLPRQAMSARIRGAPLFAASVAFSSDSRYAAVRFSGEGPAAADADGSDADWSLIRVWEVPTGWLLWTHSSSTPLGNPFFCRGDRWLAVPSPNQQSEVWRVSLWDWRTGKLRQGWLTEPTRYVLSPDGTRLAVFDYAPIRLRDMVTGAVVATLPLPRPMADVGVQVLSLAFSPDGGRLAAVLEEGSGFSSAINCVTVWRLR